MKISLKTVGAVTVFVAESTFAEKDIPKAAGFRWHGGNCRGVCAACQVALGKFWWTDKRDLAARLVEFADATAREVLAASVVAVIASRAKDSDLEVPAPHGLTYRPFQRAGIAYMQSALARFPGVVQGDDMGLGKTIQILGLVNADPTIKSVLVLCPSTLRINWEREAKKWLTREFKIEVVEESVAPRADSNFVVVNYEKLVGKPGAVVLPALAGRSWDLLVADEAQYLKNPEAQRTVAVLGSKDSKGLNTRARKTAFLTGTPIENRPIEFHPLLAACAPQEFPFWNYAKRYCAAYKGDFAWDFSGASNLEELQSRLRATVMVRRLKTEVLAELPRKVRQVIHLPVNGAKPVADRANKAFAKHEEKIAALQAEVELAEASGNEEAFKAAVRALDSSIEVAFTEMAKFRHDLGLAKVPAVVSHVRDIVDSGVKVVVFAAHHDVMDRIAAEFGSEAVALSGRNNAREKQEAVDRFQNDPSVKVFVGQILAAGVGITLTASSRVVFAESDWVPGKVSQAEDRCNRIGQTTSVLAQHLVLDGSLDAKMAKILVEKQEIADRALDLPDTDFSKMVSTATEKQKVTRAATEKKFPVATATERTAAKLAMQTLSGMCDGALQEDGMGFNKMDSRIGKSLAERAREFTDGEVSLAKCLARTYRRQLSADLLLALGIEVK